MTEHEPQESLSPFVASVSTRIQRRATEYAAEADQRLESISVAFDPTAEQALLDSFMAHVDSVVTGYDPPGIRRRDAGLVFTHLYATAREVRQRDDEFRAPRALLTALLAAEVEFRGPLRLSRTQKGLLAEVYERLGLTLAAIGLPAHAALALRRAGGLYRQNEDLDDADRCGLALARARCQAMPPGWRRSGNQFSDLVCGYGYRPFRLLGWIAVQMLVFTVAVLLLTGGPPLTALYLCMTSYLNPLGPGDTENLRNGSRWLFIVESWVGTVSMSVFFALLVRRWFRL